MTWLAATTPNSQGRGGRPRPGPSRSTLRNSVARAISRNVQLDGTMVVWRRSGERCWPRAAAGLRRGGSATGSVGRLVRKLETFAGRRVTLSSERGRCSDAGAGRQPRDGHARCSWPRSRGAGGRGGSPGGARVARPDWDSDGGRAGGAFEELLSAVATGLREGERRATAASHLRRSGNHPRPAARPRPGRGQRPRRGQRSFTPSWRSCV